MEANYVSDLRELLEEDRRSPGGDAGKLYRYLGLIAETGSVILPGEGYETPMLCANPLRRRRCGGRLAVGHVADHGVIWWECNVCGEGGSISGWQDTDWDLRESLPAATGKSIDVVLPPEELLALRRAEVKEPGLRRILAGAGFLSEEYAGFFASLSDLKKLQEVAERAAERAVGRGGVRTRRALDRLAGRLDALSVGFEDFEGIEEEAGIDVEPDAQDVIALAAEFTVEGGRDEPTREDIQRARATLRGRGKPRLH
jgi:hypothetical protein